MLVAERSIDVGVSVRPSPQRVHAAVVVMNVVDVDRVHAIHAAAVPGIEAIAGAAGQPAYTAEAAAETEAKTNSPASSAEAEERNVSRGPKRLIPGIDRPRPPTPVPAINKPAAVVIRRPAPGLIGNPGPAVVRLKHPAPIAVRSPVRPFRGKPYGAVIWNIVPLTGRVQILRARVVRIRVLPALRPFDVALAFAVPFVPSSLPGAPET